MLSGGTWRLGQGSPHALPGPLPPPRAGQNLEGEGEIAGGADSWGAGLPQVHRCLLPAELHEAEVACDVGKAGRERAGHLELFVDDLVGEGRESVRARRG